MADQDVRWIVTNAPGDKARAYAYGQTRVVIENPGEGWGPVTVCIVLGVPGATRPEYLAGVQADRLASGLYRAIVCESYADAHAVALRAIRDGEWAPVTV